MKTIAFDARMFNHPGIGRYIRELLNALLSVERGYRFVLLGPSSLKSALKSGLKQVDFQKLDTPIYSLAEQWTVIRAAAHCDALHVPHFNIPVCWKKKLVVTLHDLIYFHDPQASRLGLGRHYSRFLFNQISRKASAVIAVSDYSREDFLKSFPGARKERVWSVPEAASQAFRKINDKIVLEEYKKKAGLSSPFILFVGSLKKHKNVAALIRAFSKLRSERSIPHELVLAGRRDLRNKEVENFLKSASGVRILGEVSDEELILLYNLAELFVLPSFSEGFGLPLLEAMSCGTPVIASDRASLPEILPDADFLFDPERVDALSGLIYNILKNNELRQKMSQKNLERSRDFSWEKAAEQTLSIYRQTLN